MRYITSKCPNCGYTLRFMDREKASDMELFGQPFTICPSCRNILKNGHKEFIMMSSFDRIKYHIPSIIWAVIIGAIVGILVVEGVGSLFLGGKTLSEDETRTIMIIGMIVGVIIFELLFFWRCEVNFKKQKEQSIERTRDKEYLDTLLGIGLISKERYDAFIQQYGTINKNVDSKEKKNTEKIYSSQKNITDDIKIDVKKKSSQEKNIDINNVVKTYSQKISSYIDDNIDNFCNKIGISDSGYIYHKYLAYLIFVFEFNSDKEIKNNPKLYLDKIIDELFKVNKTLKSNESQKNKIKESIIDAHENLKWIWENDILIIQYIMAFAKDIGDEDLPDDINEVIKTEYANEITNMIKYFSSEILNAKNKK